MTACTTYRRIVSGEAEGPVPSLARGALAVMARPYGWAASLAEIARSGQTAVDVGIPVVSVGNVTVGGTGKTPFAAFVVKELLARGRRPVLLSRGWCADDTGVNDEAKVLARLFPSVIHLQGKDRVSLARHVADARLGDVLVLDDGFQYQALARRLNVCLIDATCPFGYGAVLPRGLLREPLDGLYRARPVVITRAELVQPSAVAQIEAEVLRHNPYAKVVVSEMRPVALRDVHGSASQDPSSLAGKPVLVASGIGNPAAFSRTVRLLGARVAAEVERPDHHAWTDADAKDLAARAVAADCDLVVVTAKDAVKLERLAWPAGAPRLVSLDVEVVLTRGEELWKTLLSEALA